MRYLSISVLHILCTAVHIPEYFVYTLEELFEDTTTLKVEKLFDSSTYIYKSCVWRRYDTIQ